ncbi:MAG: Sulfite reductase [ferredoxin] [bacterium]|nr:Sulfite reductase [ferredoxin] [bacterium]
MIPQEELKLRLDGLDSLELIKEYAKTGFASIQSEHFGLMRWYGVYQQKPNNGHFMLRVKIGGGQITSRQLHEIADISHEHGQDLADITTRQNIQFHWMTIESLPEAIERLRSVGLSTTGACGDVTRNVVGCPVAGLDAAEFTDATTLLRSVEQRLLGNRRYSNLPRKFKISVAGCHIGCAQPLINDIGVVAARLKSDPKVLRYEIFVGGGLSTTPKFAQRLRVAIEAGEVTEVCEQIVGIFRDYGNRENRKRARMKFLVEQWGPERFRATIEERLGRKLEDWSNDFELPKITDDDHVGVFPQAQTGLSYVGVPVKTGRLNSVQLHRMAEAAERFGKGRLRFTNHQNFLVPDVPNDAVGDLCAFLDEVGLDARASRTRRLLVACTGNQFCNLALSETKQTAARIVDRIEELIPREEGLRIHLSGCPNSCAQFQTGDIGLTGVTFQKKGEEDKIEAYNVFAGGGYGESPTFGRRLALKVPKEDLPDFLAGVYRTFASRRASGESFQEFCARLSDAELTELARNGS